MITDYDLFAAIAHTVSQVDTGAMSVEAGTANMRMAMKAFDAQPTEVVESEAA